ncbi:MAG: AtpZ/AtpI family protein [Candidatus Moranbacteria bacterium]|nr:AtpZ/AtpI family protein [Candidatus Moranbacteria bacterium]
MQKKYPIKPDKKQKSDSSWSAVGLAWELGYTIAVPLVALALLGRFLDKKLGTAPWLLLLGILVSIAVSSWLVYKKTLDIIGK